MALRPVPLIPLLVSLWSWVAMALVPVPAAQGAVGVPRCARLMEVAPRPAAGLDARGDPGFNLALEGRDLLDTRLPSSFSQVPRVGVWGDSHLASGDFIEAALAAWGVPKERVQAAALPLNVGTPGVRLPLRAACATAGWQLQLAHRTVSREAQPMRNQAELSADTPGETLWLDFRSPGAPQRVRRLDLLLGRRQDGRALLLGLAVDGLPERVLSLTDFAGQRLQVQPDRPLSTLRVRLIAGQVRLEGLEVVPDPVPTVLMDLFATPGSTAAGWGGLRGSPARYDLALFGFGTNEAMDPAFDEAAYTVQLRQSLAAFRRQVRADRCVLVGPPDRDGLRPAQQADAVKAGGLALPRRDPGPPDPAGLDPRAARPRSHSAAHHLVSEVQRRVAPEFGCQFWDWQAAMGGPGAHARWRAAVPSLAQSDGVHLTPLGYEASGRLFARAVRPPTVNRSPTP